MQKGKFKFHIGLRTLKTAVAIVIAMVVVDLYGATGDKLIFAMLGAMAVMEPTFKDSLTACVSQIAGTLFGAVFGILLSFLPLGPMLRVGIGIIAIIVFYNGLHIRLSPSLPCFIMVMLCVSDSMNPVTYALGRSWDTTIGLIVGMAVNMLIFPYNNSRQIRETMRSLDRDLIAFLEDVFDGDQFLPDPDGMEGKIAALQKQLGIFANQRFLLHRRRQARELEDLRACDRRAKDLVAHLAVLARMEMPGRLNAENRRRLQACGATIRDQRTLDSVMEIDVVTNYHVQEILTLRRELMDALQNG